MIDSSATIPSRKAMRDFLTIWAGQVISLFGSSLTSFSLGVWVYQRTGMATKFALMGFFSSFPAILFSPVAGALVDRWDRRWAMILSDFGSALTVLFLAALLFMGHLQLSSIYAALVVSSLFTAFQCRPTRPSPPCWSPRINWGVPAASSRAARRPVNCSRPPRPASCWQR